MPAVSYTKLYADLVAPDGTVCITYASWLRFLGQSRFFGGVELYPADGGRIVERARSGVLKNGSPIGGDGACTEAGAISLELSLDRGFFLLSVEPRTPRTPAKNPHAGLAWTVLAPRAEVVAAWFDHERPRELRGIGYADLVVLERMTRQYPLRSLTWGRVHLDEDTAVFSQLAFRSGDVWEHAALFNPLCSEADEADSTDATRLVSLWHEGNLLIAGNTPRGPVEYRLTPARCLHDGTIIDRERFPHPVERALLSNFTGRSHETRWLSRAVAADAQEGWAVHEEVFFGRNATERGATTMISAPSHKDYDMAGWRA